MSKSKILKYKTVVPGNGTSLWGTSNGKYKINKFEVTYINWLAYPSDPTKLFASLDLFGSNTTINQYTDKGIEKHLNKDQKLLSLIRVEIKRLLKETNNNREIPEKIMLSWSEYGLQHQKGWNFDIYETT